MFGAGGGTSSYREVEETDLIVLWGSNARETHPIFFHHVLKGVHNGARLYAVDPRRTSSRRVGRRLARPRRRAATSPWPTRSAREIIAAGLANREFIDRATIDFEAYKAKVESYTLEYAERETGVPAEAIRELAHAFATAPRAMICWTLGITEHHNAVDNVLALISLVAADRARRPVRQRRQPAARPEQRPGRRRHGRPARPAARASSTSRTTRSARSSTPSGASPVPPKRGWHLSGMFDAMERGDLTAVYCIGENPVQSEADQKRAIAPAVQGLDFLVVQDLFLTKTAELADVVLPATAAWAETEGTVTNSERRVQRVRKAVEPPDGARDDLAIVFELANRMGAGWGEADPETVWNEVRRLSPVHAGMSYARLEDRGRAPVAVLRRDHPGELFLHSPAVGGPGPGQPRAVRAGRPRPAGRPARRRLPDPADDRPPPRLVQHRRPDRRLHLAAAARRDPRHLARRTPRATAWPTASVVRVVSRRGQVEVPIRIDESLRPGLTFMTMHFQDEVAVNLLTIDATDPKSGTAEFKATAIRIEKLGAPVPA